MNLSIISKLLSGWSWGRRWPPPRTVTWNWKASRDTGIRIWIRGRPITILLMQFGFYQSIVFQSGMIIYVCMGTDLYRQHRKHVTQSRTRVLPSQIVGEDGELIRPRTKPLDQLTPPYPPPPFFPYLYTSYLNEWFWFLPILCVQWIRCSPIFCFHCWTKVSHRCTYS